MLWRVSLIVINCFFFNFWYYKNDSTRNIKKNDRKLPTMPTLSPSQKGLSTRTVHPALYLIKKSCESKTLCRDAARNDLEKCRSSLIDEWRRKGDHLLSNPSEKKRLDSTVDTEPTRSRVSGSRMDGTKIFLIDNTFATLMMTSHPKCSTTAPTVTASSTGRWGDFGNLDLFVRGSMKVWC